MTPKKSKLIDTLALLDDVAQRFLPRIMIAFLAFIGLLYIIGLARPNCTVVHRAGIAEYRHVAGDPVLPNVLPNFMPDVLPNVSEASQ